MLRPWTVVALSFALATSALAAYSRTQAPASVVFHGSGPGGFKIEGKTAELAVADSEKLLTFTVPLRNMTTGIALRDKHMKEKYLEVEKFPETRLEVEKAALPAPPAAGAKADAKLKGKLTLHGVTREVPFTVQATCDAAGLCNTTGQLAININDFGIVIPKYLGVTMKPELTIDIAFQLATK